METKTGDNGCLMQTLIRTHPSTQTTHPDPDRLTQPASHLDRTPDRKSIGGRRASRNPRVPSTEFRLWSVGAFRGGVIFFAVSTLRRCTVQYSTVYSIQVSSIMSLSLPLPPVNKSPLTLDDSTRCDAKKPGKEESGK